MLMRISVFPTVAVAVVAIGLLVGCTQSGDDAQPEANGDTPKASAEDGAAEAVDPHDVPLTDEEIAQLKADTARYEDAIEHIQKFQTTIQQETTAGEPAKAHRALDNLDVVLERLPEAAQESGVPKDKWQEVNETAQKLRDLFNQVHSSIDAGQAPDYGSVAEEIDQGIQALAAIQPEPTE